MPHAAYVSKYKGDCGPASTSISACQPSRFFFVLLLEDTTLQVVLEGSMARLTCQVMLFIISTQGRTVHTASVLHATHVEHPARDWEAQTWPDVLLLHFYVTAMQPLQS